MILGFGKIYEGTSNAKIIFCNIAGIRWIPINLERD